MSTTHVVIFDGENSCFDIVRDKIEFKVGDTVTYQPYSKAYADYVVVQSDTRAMSFRSADSRIFYGLVTRREYQLHDKRSNHPIVPTTFTTGRSILESIYYTENSEELFWAREL